MWRHCSRLSGQPDSHMSFVPFGQGADVTLGVVAYGSSERLRACLASLVRHESDARFDVVVVLNPDERRGTPSVQGLTPGVHVITPDANLGWAGGMHLVRHATSATWLGWIQDDSEVLPGWLDAHWHVAQERPRAGALGAVAVDGQGRAAGFSGGWANAGSPVGEWNDTDPTRDGDIPGGVEQRHWLTSKGMLVRTAAWDDVGGPCARQYPLNHVDKEFSTHLRCHGWELLVVPGAHVSHLQSQSAPSLFRHFLETWQEDEFNARWMPALESLSRTPGSRVDHDCHGHPDVTSIEYECLAEASRMLVPLGKYAATQVAYEQEQRRREAQVSESAIAALRREFTGSTSWKMTAPLRWFGSAVRRLLGRP